MIIVILKNINIPEFRCTKKLHSLYIPYINDYILTSYINNTDIQLENKLCYKGFLN